MKALNEKAMLVKLTTRRINLTRRDQVAEHLIQQQLDDSSLIVNSKLFRDKTNPIYSLMSLVSECYTYHRNNTLPYMDKGPRILPVANYEEYTREMRSRFARVESEAQSILPQWDTLVNRDIAYRSQNPTKPQRASVSDYPTVEEFSDKLGFDMRFMPLPDSRHFLFDIDEADMKALDESVAMAERIARDDAVKRMLTPLSHLVEKLNKPIDSEGSIFRDSAVENIIEGIEQARKLCLDESPEIQNMIKELNDQVSKYAVNTDWLRQSPPIREQAAKQLSDIASKMGAFMGAV